jgi:hypothetical protein
MKRDLDLVRQILLEIEAAPPGTIIQKLTCKEFDEATIIEHIDIMIEANLLDGDIFKTFDCNGNGYLVSSGYLVRKITWQGHDFLDNARNGANSLLSLWAEHN